MSALIVALLLAPPLLGAPRQDDLVTINVRDEELTSLLEGLSVQHRINLVAGDEVEGRVTINLYDVPLEDALAQILAAQGLAYVREGDFYRVVTAKELADIQLARDVIETRVFTLNHLTGKEAQALLVPLMSEYGQLSMPGEESTSAGGSGGSGGESGEGGTGRREVIVVRERQSHLAVIAATLEELDRPPQQVLLEATLINIDLGEENVFGIDFNLLGGIDFDAIGASTDLTGIGPYEISGSTLDDLLFSGQTFGFTNDPPSGGLSLGLVKNQAAVFLEALEETTNASILSNPKVIALNGQEARIIVGGRLGYATVVSTQTSALEEVQFLDTGTQLKFRPHIGDDGWIRMDVHPQNSTGIIDPVSGIPSESTAEITTSVLMRDGQTLVIGGLISEQLQTLRSQIPLLGERSELVILLTPHIIDPIEEERRAEEVLERWEAVHRSHLDSLSSHLRPQMARSLYEDAEVLRVQDDLDGALGAVERALSLDPTSVPAAMLRQDLLRSLALEELPLSEEQQSLRALEGLDPPRPPTAVGTTEEKGT
jgi:type II secretory pathway component GspD/PulD (secretin)